MGDTPPVWNNGRRVLQPGSGANGKPEPVFHTCDGRVPYNVGRTRARAQLKLALTTEEESSQLRRLNEALDSNRFDRYLSRELGNAAMTARELSRKLGHEEELQDFIAPLTNEGEQGEKKTKQKQAPEVQQASSTEAAGARQSELAQLALEADMEADLAQQELAAVRIQAIQRGKQGRKEAQSKKESAELP